MPAPTSRVPVTTRFGPVARTLLAVPVCASLLWLSSSGLQHPAEPLGAPFDPDAHRWQHRLLFVFGTSPGDPDVAAQHEVLVAQPAALVERDLVVVRLYDDAVGEGDNQPITPEQTAALRARYGVAPGAFAVLLVGKDGGMKLRAERPVTLDAIAELIDTMPMRQAEMREHEQPSK